MSVLRNIGAVVAGLFVGSCVNMGLIRLNSTVLFPMPEGMDPNDLEQFVAYTEGLPATAFLVVMAAHLGQAGVGGWLAARLAGSRPLLLALIVGGATLLGGLMMLVMVPAPVWMWVEIPLYIVVAYGVGTIEVKRRAKPG